MDGLDAPSLVEFDPPTARIRSSSDEKTLTVAVFWMARPSLCTHSYAITGRKRLLRFRQSVCCRSHAGHSFTSIGIRKIPPRLAAFQKGEVHRISFPKRAREGARTKSGPIAAGHPCWPRFSVTPIPVGSSRQLIRYRATKILLPVTRISLSSRARAAMKFPRKQRAKDVVLAVLSSDTSLRASGLQDYREAWLRHVRR